MKARDATAHDPGTGQFTAGAGASPSTKSEHKQQSAYHKAEAEKHFNDMHAHNSKGAVGAARQSRAKWQEHKKAAEHHSVKAREEMVPTGTGRSIPKSQVSKTTRALLGWKGRDSALAGDSKEKATMPTTAKLSPTAAVAWGALNNYLSPRLAQDAKMPDLKTILLGTTARNIADRAGKIARDVKRAVRGRLAQDADVDDVEEVIDAIQEMAPEIAEAASEPDQEQLNAVTENDDEAKDSPEAMAKALEFLKDKLSPEDLNAFTEMMGEEEVVPPPVEDETEEERMERERREAEDSEAGTARSGAMDAKAVKRVIKLAVDSARAEAREDAAALRDAERFVRPLVGELGIACDSAEEVYRHALKMRGISDEALKRIPPEGYRPMLEALPRQGAPRTPALATDAKLEGSFHDRFPGAKRIGLRG